MQFYGSIVLLALFSGQQCLHFGVLCALYLLAIKCLMVGGTYSGSLVGTWSASSAHCSNKPHTITEVHCSFRLLTPGKQEQDENVHEY